jgi:hypothetical protein
VEAYRAKASSSSPAKSVGKGCHLIQRLFWPDRMRSIKQVGTLSYLYGSDRYRKIFFIFVF